MEPRAIGISGKVESTDSHHLHHSASLGSLDRRRANTTIHPRGYLLVHTVSAVTYTLTRYHEVLLHISDGLDKNYPA